MAVRADRDGSLTFCEGGDAMSLYEALALVIAFAMLVVAILRYKKK